MSKELLIDTAPIRFRLEESANGRLSARGVFARSGVPTANGRIYPESVWRKNIAKLQKDIKENKVLSELDHPCLTSSDFMVMTKNGWKPFLDVKVGDEVWSRKDGKAVLSVVEGIVNQPYEGDAFQVKGEMIEGGFTPDHRFLLVNKENTDIEIYFKIKDIDQASGLFIPDWDSCNLCSLSELKIDKTYHKGNIYCLSVTHGNFYMEHKGKSFWTGNSDGKTKLQRVAAKITDLVIEDDGTVTGALEVVEGTPNGDILSALIDANCTVGVSSRGYGSVKMNEHGKDVVQDDFTLLTFDVVTDPANATSWPDFSREGGAEESKETKGDVLIEAPKVEKEVIVEKVQIKEPVKTESIENLVPWSSDIDAMLADVEHYLPNAEKDAPKMKRIKNALRVVKSLLSENVALTAVAKELGFSLFIERNLNQHPRYKEIVESLGDLKQYDSLEDLKGLLKVHMEDAKEFQRRQKIEESYNLTKLEQEFRIASEDLRSLIEEKDVEIQRRDREIAECNSQLASMKNEVKLVKEKLTEAKARVYLESKIANHPRAFRIRKLWESSKLFDNSKIDFLVESLTEIESVTEAKTFDAVRQSLRRRGVRENIVESSVSGTTLDDAIKNFQGAPNKETEFFSEDFDALAGLKK